MDKNELVTVEWLRDGENGIDVTVCTKEGHRHAIKNVHPNVVRCAIGEQDMEYYLPRVTGSRSVN